MRVLMMRMLMLIITADFLLVFELNFNRCLIDFGVIFDRILASKRGLIRGLKEPYKRPKKRAILASKRGLIRGLKEP